MTKKVTKKAIHNVAIKIAGVNPYLAALQRVASLVTSFAYVQNPPTQFTQRFVNIKATIRTPDAKNPVKVEVDHFIPARLTRENGKVDYDKRYARALLTAYALGKVKNPKAEVLHLAGYLAAKVMTSRPRSLEGVNAAQCLHELQATAGVVVESSGDYDHEALTHKCEELFNFLAQGVESGFVTAVRGKRKQGNAAELNL